MPPLKKYLRSSLIPAIALAVAFFAPIGERQTTGSGIGNTVFSERGYPFTSHLDSDNGITDPETIIEIDGVAGNFVVYWTLGVFALYAPSFVRSKGEQDATS